MFLHTHLHTPRGDLQEPGEGTIRRVAGVLSHSGGMSVGELCKGLGVSRQTMVRWLAVMEENGFVSRALRVSGKKGRPLGIYHPTNRLSEFTGWRLGSSTVSISFSSIAGVCKYNSGRRCGDRANPSGNCGSEFCALLKGPAV